ncbi:putative bifunctional diguanylate cyclase/phosphodiesterase [Mycobacterium sp.]|uniref:putative bifunctional diguanylate cyclase/phosphodiesterase n=1 Tax=Mycobacterium sp. TaxID=1785 RepID=UPI002D87382C|nr:bifunctional diguanylate cyclase/phosphodiesterase [Mycobacterium sp.]
MPKPARVAGIATVIAIAFAAWAIAGWGGESTVRIVNESALVGFAVFATVCAGLAARSARGRERTAWIWLTVGLAGWAVGEALWAYYELVARTDPFPSVADAAYLLYPVCTCVALVLFPVGQSGLSRTRIVLDALIVAIALFEISWVTALQPVYEDGGDSPFALGLSLAYPVTDIIVVTVALLVLARARSGRMVLILLALGNVLNAVADSIWVYLDAHDAYVKGSVVDIGWLAGLLLISIAALTCRRTPHTEEARASVPSRTATWLPYIPLIPAAAICAPNFMSIAGLAPIVYTSMVLIVVVLARQFLVVGQNRRLLEMVADQALRDPLTGLANRALFSDRLTHAMQLHQRDNQSVAVMSLDLDDFKLVNDNLGHPAGDVLLTLAAERIVRCVRTADTVARLGGDEFAVLMEGDAQHSRVLAQRVVRAFDEPFVVDSHDWVIRPSVGLAIASPDDPDTSADKLLKQADVAMYSAKRSRAGGVHTYAPGMYVSARGGAGVRLLDELRHAIDNLDLTVVYQPKFDLRDGLIVGVEALVRWPHPKRGMLGPDEFLPLVRKHGLMRSVTELVLAQALDDAAQWYSQGIELPIAVNVFAPSLGDLKLPGRVVRAVTERNLRPETLTVEITEDLLLDNMDRTRAVLHELRQNGIRVAVDDFGSGYSALRYLRDLPIDEVKMDRQFIAPLLGDSRSAAIVRAVIDLAHALGLTTVAEGVENAETAEQLRRYGCDIAQGFYYSAPLAADDVLELISATKEPAAARSN